jgi:hypothetical protein
MKNKEKNQKANINPSILKDRDYFVITYQTGLILKEERLRAIGSLIKEFFKDSKEKFDLKVAYIQNNYSKKNKKRIPEHNFFEWLLKKEEAFWEQEFMNLKISDKIYFEISFEVMDESYIENEQLFPEIEACFTVKIWATPVLLSGLINFWAIMGSVLRKKSDYNKKTEWCSLVRLDKPASKKYIEYQEGEVEETNLW